MSRCLVTGASRGIGRAIAERLASAGYEIIAHGRDEQALAATVEAIVRGGNQARAVVADLATISGIEKVAGVAKEKPLDLLIHNAGIAVVKPFEQVSDAEWNTTLAINVTAPFILTGKIAPGMPEGSSIVNILSVAAKTGFPNWSSYCMSKFALEGLMQSIREELRSRRIRVVNIYPSATKTDMWQAIEGDWPSERMLDPGEVAEAVYYAVSRPSNVLVENISVGDISGTL